MVACSADVLPQVALTEGNGVEADGPYALRVPKIDWEATLAEFRQAEPAKYSDLLRRIAPWLRSDAESDRAGNPPPGALRVVDEMAEKWAAHPQLVSPYLAECLQGVLRRLSPRGVDESLYRACLKFPQLP